MEITITAQFERAYNKLAKAEKQIVLKSLALLGDNLKMEGRKNIWEARPSERLRMTFELSGQTIIMRNVGEHDGFTKAP
ncbi:hypothetical protein ACFLWV_04265 [Chloroflexota bacterium]